MYFLIKSLVVKFWLERYVGIHSEEKYATQVSTQKSSNFLTLAFVLV